MKTITLTKSESKLFDKSTENTPLGKLLNMVVFRGNGIIEIHCVDKFREFLNDEIAKIEDSGWGAVSWILLLSILSKLDKEVK